MREKYRNLLTIYLVYVCVLECLQSGGIVTNIKEEGSSDKLSMITSSNDGPVLR